MALLEMSGRGKTMKKSAKAERKKGLAFLLKGAQTKKVKRDRLMKDLETIVEKISELVEVNPMEYLKRVVRLLNATIEKYKQETDIVGAQRDEDLITELEAFMGTLAENMNTAIISSLNAVKPKSFSKSFTATNEDMNADDLGDLMATMGKMSVKK
jgi:hypothetical protein